MKLRNALLAVGAICAMAASAVIIPPSLKPGDKIALFTPSSACDSMKVVRLDSVIRAYGYTPVMAPHANTRDFGTYPAREDVRAADLMALFRDPEIKAIISTRGGHGGIHMLDYLDPEVIRANPKWLTGYSDVTVLHSVMRKAGVASVHGPMSEMISHPDDQATKDLFAILAGNPNTVEAPYSPLNQLGTVAGRLYGGNLITFNELCGTDFDLLADLDADGEGVILFIEEVEEQMYAVERLMVRLHRAGLLHKVRGLMFGYFTDCKGDADYPTVNAMLRSRLEQWGYIHPDGIPIAFDVPFGHEWPNYPLIEGSTAVLSVTPEGTTVVQLAQ